MKVSLLAAPRITAAMLSTVVEAPAAVVVLDESAGSVRLQPCLTSVQAADPAIVVLLDHYGARTWLAQRGTPAAAAAAATAEARLAVAA
jgi:hypothetical protein